MTNEDAITYFKARVELLEEAMFQFMVLVPPESAAAFAKNYQTRLGYIEKMFPANEKPLIITEAN